MYHRKCWFWKKSKGYLTNLLSVLVYAKHCFIASHNKGLYWRRYILHVQITQKKLPTCCLARSAKCEKRTFPFLSFLITIHYPHLPEQRTPGSVWLFPLIGNYARNCLQGWYIMMVHLKEKWKAGCRHLYSTDCGWLLVTILAPSICAHWTLVHA